jgi:predicted dehydrogenase
MTRTAIIGFGLAGEQFHAPGVHAQADLTLAAIVTANAERAARARATYPHATVVASVDDLWALDIGLVVVATPNQFHVPHTQAALDHGAAVVIDKPATPTAAELAELIGRADRVGLPLTVFQNRRWDPDFLSLRAALDSGELGVVHRFESRFDRWRPEAPADRWREHPEAAGGLLYDLGTHLIDQALVAFGPVVSVYAELDRRRPGTTVDDDMFVALTHTSGTRSHLWAGNVVAQLAPRLRALGSTGAFVTEGVTGPGVGSTAARIGVDGAVRALPTPLPDDSPFWNLLADAVAGRGPLPVDPRDSLMGLQIVEAARRSHASGETARL